MKNWNWCKKMSVFAIGASMLLPNTVAFAKAPAHDMRAVWISTVYSADYPSTTNNPTAQKQEFIEKLDKIQALGLNTVVVQIRPKGDAFYTSAINPWSAVLTGTQGQNPGYDPMAFMIAETHKRGMEFHAWMNPYRITTSGTDLATLSGDHIARKHPEWIMTHKNAMYFNPAKEEVKQYIVDSVAEVVQNYDVDAIHFDDYFYPSNYPLPQGEGRDGAVANERRGHVDDLIARVSKKIHSIKPNVDFGISPMGIWKNNTSDPKGSATKGAEGYYAVYGDAKKWIEQEWVDYITPQIYWEIGNPAADYETLVKWWNDAVEGTDVDLYIGQGIYKDNIAAGMENKLKINEKYPNVDGNCYFSLRDLLQNRKGVADAVKAYHTKGSQPAPQTPPVVQPPAPQPQKPEPQKPQPQKPKKPKPTETKTAFAGRAKIKIDGNMLDLPLYIVDDYSYFKLRDIAAAFRDTEKKFVPKWVEEEMAIHLETKQAYTEPVSINTSSKDTVAIPSSAKLYVDGKQQDTAAYTIQDYTYYKLRDVAELLDFEITWSEKDATISIKSDMPYQK